MANPETASFPTAIATDADLPPVTDRWESYLAVDISASDLAIDIERVDGPTLPCILTIYSDADGTTPAEQVLITSGTIIGPGVPPTLNVDASGRGYAGTTAQSHAAGVLIRVNLVAKMINQLCAHVKAMQTLLGIGGQSIPARRRFMKSGDGDFTVPGAVTRLFVTLVAGGGGGAGATSNKGGGGGGAGEVRQFVLEGCTPGATITCTYGAGGTGGGVNSPGNNGTSTSITGSWTAPVSASESAYGGQGGGQSGDVGDGGHSGYLRDALGAGTFLEGYGGVTTNSYNIGGTYASTGPLSGGGSGQIGTSGHEGSRSVGPNSRVTFTARTNIYKGGNGGGCLYGTPGYASQSAAGGAVSEKYGIAGTGYGCGGGGGSYDASTVAAGNGSAGRPGCIIFEW